MREAIESPACAIDSNRPVGIYVHAGDSMSTLIESYNMGRYDFLVDLTENPEHHNMGW